MAVAAAVRDEHLVEHLRPIFPALSKRVIQLSVEHPTNRDEPLDEGRILRKCIDDLLELRTLKESDDLREEQEPEEGNFQPGSPFQAASTPGVNRRDAAPVPGPSNKDLPRVGDIALPPPLDLTLIPLPSPIRYLPPLAANIKQEPASPSGTGVLEAGEDVVVLDETDNSLGSPNALPQVSPKRKWHLVGDEVENGAKKEKPADEEDDILKNQVETVRQLFPLADPEYISLRLKVTLGQNRVEVVCNELLEDPNYRRIKKAETKASNCSQGSSHNYYEDFIGPVTSEYRRQAMHLLQCNFRKVSVKDIRSITKSFAYHYAPTHKCIYDALMASGINVNSKEMASPARKKVCKSMEPSIASGLEVSFEMNPSSVTAAARINSGHGSEEVHNMTLLKYGRNKVRNMGLDKLEAALKSEIDYMINFTKTQNEVKDTVLAEMVNEDEYSDNGQLIECGCCYGEYPFEKMVQCYEGHLFCCECLHNYAKEAVYGQGKTSLSCMTDECEATFPKAQLNRALPTEMLNKYEERLCEDDLNLADIDGLVRCPGCNFAAVISPEEKVFSCQNPTCQKATCRYCKEDWEDHFGIPCKELEKKDETKLRLAYEEKMTQAKIRACHKCKASFTKSEGCNKMTCRCGAKMCYICRKPDIDYNHFCRHARDPGCQCTQCKECSLWTNPEEDDERAIEEIKKAAQAERSEKGFTTEKQIGAPEEARPKATAKAPDPAPAQAEAQAAAAAPAPRQRPAPAPAQAQAAAAALAPRQRPVPAQARAQAAAAAPAPRQRPAPALPQAPRYAQHFNYGRNVQPVQNRVLTRVPYAPYGHQRFNNVQAAQLPQRNPQWPVLGPGYRQDNNMQRYDNWLQ